jgi:hypothetical protein
MTLHHPIIRGVLAVPVFLMTCSSAAYAQQPALSATANGSLVTVTYNFASGADEGTTNVHIIDVISSHCGSNPGPAWQDVTGATRAAGTIGRWTLLPVLPYLPR